MINILINRQLWEETFQKALSQVFLPKNDFFFINKSKLEERGSLWRRSLVGPGVGGSKGAYQHTATQQCILCDATQHCILWNAYQPNLLLLLLPSAVHRNKTENRESNYYCRNFEVKYEQQVNRAKPPVHLNLKATNLLLLFLQESQNYI